MNSLAYFNSRRTSHFLPRTITSTHHLSTHLIYTYILQTSTFVTSSDSFPHPALRLDTIGKSHWAHVLNFSICITITSSVQIIPSKASTNGSQASVVIMSANNHNPMASSPPSSEGATYHDTPATVVSTYSGSGSSDKEKGKGKAKVKPGALTIKPIPMNDPFLAAPLAAVGTLRTPTSAFSPLAPEFTPKPDQDDIDAFKARLEQQRIVAGVNRNQGSYGAGMSAHGVPQAQAYLAPTMVTLSVSSTQTKADLHPGTPDRSTRYHWSRYAWSWYGQWRQSLQHRTSRSSQWSWQTSHHRCLQHG